jgi:predicted nucleotidyltransferase
MIQKIKNKLLPTKPISKIFEYGYLMGSRALGVATDKSDWDIVVPIWYRADAEMLLSTWAHYQDYSNYFKGTYYYIYPEGSDDLKASRCINLIFVHYHDFKPWVLTTEALKSVLQKEQITNKEDRILLFETLRAQLRYILPEVTRETYQADIKRLCAEGFQSEIVNEFLQVFSDCNRIPYINEF